MLPIVQTECSLSCSKRSILLIPSWMHTLTQWATLSMQRRWVMTISSVVQSFTYLDPWQGHPRWKGQNTDMRLKCIQLSRNEQVTSAEVVVPVMTGQSETWRAAAGIVEGLQWRISHRQWQWYSMVLLLKLIFLSTAWEVTVVNHF